MHLIQKVKKNIQNNHCFGRNDTILAGVSGGPDSIALTYVLHSLQYELGFHMHIAHYNHNLHRKANADQKFVEQLAEQLNIPCSTDLWHNSKTRGKGSLEEAARQQRFKFFSKIAKKINAKAVVLAHTEDDLAETVLMRILRGTGLQGLRGILPEREIQGIHYVRPLLNIKKKDILLFLKKKNIPFRIDPTNNQLNIFRNRIRLELLPLLAKHYNQNTKELLANLAEHASTDYSYLESQSQRLFGKLIQYSARSQSVRIDLKSLAKQHTAVQRMLIRQGISELKGDTRRLTLAHFREIEDLLQNRPNHAIVHLPRNISARKDSRYLTLAHQ